MMTQVTVSTKYQVVIPKEVRRQVPVHTGQKFTMVVKEGTITLLPNRPLSRMRGFLKGMSGVVHREKHDRF
jgi:AbrB family looped-hinge helix DNA binding protein